DGIRAFHVTGVQTCALPIFESPIRWTVGRCSVSENDKKVMAAATSHNARVTLNFIIVSFLVLQYGLPRVMVRTVADLPPYKSRYAAAGYRPHSARQY